MPSRNDALFLFVLISLVAFLGGCTGPWLTPSCFPYPPDFDHRLAKGNRTEKISAFADVTITRGSKIYKMTATVIFQGPRRMRMEILSPIGTPEVMLSVVEGKTRIYIPSRQEFHRDVRDLSPLIDLPVEAETLTALIFGALPQPKSDACMMPPRREDGLLRYEIVSSEGKRRIEAWIEEDGEPRKIKISTEGSFEVTATYGKMIKINGLSFPQRINIAAPALSVSFAFSDIELLAGDTESLELPVPEHITSSRATWIAQCSPDWYWDTL